jgi:hypothetical protein
LDKALIDFRLRQNAEAFVSDLSGDEMHGAIPAGSLATAGGIDLHTGAPRRVKKACTCMYIKYDPGWLKSYERHNSRFPVVIPAQAGI